MRIEPRVSYHYPSATATEIIPCVFLQLQPCDELPLCMRQEFYELGSDTGLHQHTDFYALYIVESGKGIHVINQHPYGIARGDVYVLPPGTIHAYRDYHELTICAFYFQPHLFQAEEQAALRALSGFWKLLVRTSEKSDEEDHTQLDDHQLHLPPERYHSIEEMIQEIQQEFRTSDLEARLLTRALLFRMLVHLARWHTNTQQQKREKRALKHKAELAHVLHFCEEHFAEELSVPQLAASMFLSPSRFSELFVREIGMSPATYIRRLRLERARTLLRTTNATSTSIAHQVGFRDSAQFSRSFRAVFQMTPTAYRASFR